MPGVKRPAQRGDPGDAMFPIVGRFTVFVDDDFPVVLRRAADAETQCGRETAVRVAGPGIDETPVERIAAVEAPIVLAEGILPAGRKSQPVDFGADVEIG